MSKIQSMTGFGRAEKTNQKFYVKVEMHSVNRKNSEVVVQLPKALLEIESDIKNCVAASILRGRVQVNITIEPAQAAEAEASVDHAKLKGLIKACEEISKTTGCEINLNLADMMRIGGIITLEQEYEWDADLAKSSILPVLDEALKQLIFMREAEGKHMIEDVLGRIATLEKEVKVILERAPHVITHYREALKKRLEESGLELDLNDERLLKEIGIFAERCDISEEIARLDSHFIKFRDYLTKDESVGRSLDFLCQELNREFNTIGSKANDAEIAHAVVRSKTELEKAREQVQNIA